MDEEQKKAFAKMLSEQLELKIREMGLDKPALKAINGDGPDAVTVEGKEKVGKFFKAFAAGDMVELKTLSEGVDADGGYLVPSEFHAMMLEKLHHIPAIRNIVSIFPMTRDIMDVPAEGNAVTTQWGSENQDMSASESNPTFGNVKLSTNILFGYSSISRQLAADSPLKVAEILAKAYAISFAKAENSAFVAGSGTGQPKGLRSYTLTQAITQAGASLVKTDVEALFFKLPVQYRQNAHWFLNNDAIRLINALQDSNGVKYFPELLKEGKLLGKPVMEMNDIPSNLGTGTNETEIYFGDPSFYLIGDREKVALESTTVGGDAFKKHRVDVKGYERMDGQLGILESFAKMTAVK